LDRDVSMTDDETIAVEFGRSAVVSCICVREGSQLHVEDSDGNLEGRVGCEILIVFREIDEGRWHV
jgi:hypothetical protein